MLVVVFGRCNFSMLARRSRPDVADAATHEVVMGQITGGALLVRTLVDAGVRKAFGLHGAHLETLLFRKS